jgi:hypothetical protein
MENLKKKPSKKPVDLSQEHSEPKFFDVPAEIKNELTAKGLVCRWISRKAWIENHGYHKSGWVAYKTGNKKLSADSMDFGLGVDVEGYLRRGDLVLAVKKKESNDARKAMIEKKNKALNRYTKTAAEDLKRALGDKGSVIEGYDENGGDD